MFQSEETLVGHIDSDVDSYLMLLTMLSMLMLLMLLLDVDVDVVTVAEDVVLADDVAT